VVRASGVLPDDLTSDALTADFRLLQRVRGHRFSLDDLATAWVAARARPEARVALDLGCGIGSVLLMIAWRLPSARCFGIEAQEISFALAQRNVIENGASERVTVALGDLRELARPKAYPPCDLVTGTPPYLPLGTALLSPDPQRAAARIELRGGVEDYLLAASRVLAPDGRAVVCADGRFPARVRCGAAAAGLAPLQRVDVFPRASAKDPLLAVWTCAPLAAVTPGPIEEERIVMRDERGERSPASREMRRFFGLDLV
jgi:tRNA1Val (adenine37-N6)-methyltransferase